MRKVCFCFFLIISITVRCQPLKHLIAVADSKIYVEETGAGPAVILLHGGNLDHRIWAGQVQVFSKQYRVLNLDLRGCGLTQDGDSTYLQSDAILAVMDSLKISQAALIGLSLGAVAATDFALAHPEKVSKLLLASPGLIGFDLNHDSALIHHYQEMENALKKHDTAAYTEAFIRAWFDGPLRTPAQVNKVLRQKVFSIAYETISKRRDGVHPGFIFEPTQLERLPALYLPVLVLVGTKDMKDILMIAAEWKKAGAKIVRLPGLAHLINMEKPTVFNRYVLQFLH